MRQDVPGFGVRGFVALAPLLALLLSCGSSTHGVADGGLPDVGQGPELTVTTTSLPGGMVDVNYYAVMAAKGGLRPLNWQVSEGSLPPGLSMNSTTGKIDGVPTQEGQFALTIQAVDSGIPQRSDSVPLTLRIQPRPGPVSITTTALPNAQVGVAYSVTLEASGGALPYAWSVASGGLPDGLRLTFTLSGGNSTWTIGGMPTKVGDWSFVVRVNDSMTPSQNATQPLTISVTPPPPIVIATTSLPDGMVGHAYHAALTATGGLPPYAWQLVSGAMPGGLSLPTMSNDGGVYNITGTPTTVETTTFTVRVVDSFQPPNQAVTQLSIVINPPPQDDAGVQDDAAPDDVIQQDVNQTDGQDDAAPDGGPTDA